VNEDQVDKNRKQRLNLEHEHHPESIQERITGEQDHSYLGDAILGAMDGGVTTFGVITGAVGGGFGSEVVVVLGFAKLIADGFSMAVSNYLNIKSNQDRIDDARKKEKAHIEQIPEGEKQEIRHIFAQKGFEGPILDRIVETITQDHDQWVDVMLSEELGLPVETPNPLGAAFSTFLAFIGVGIIPLFPFLLGSLTISQALWISGLITGTAFLGIGIFKGYVLNQSMVRSGIQTLLTGIGAAALAYLVSAWLKVRYGVQ
jgi:VIT1/CCC1 family predicted Fe2+/Mn2+ transporter